MKISELTIVTVLGPRDWEFWSVARRLLEHHFRDVALSFHIVDNYKVVPPVATPSSTTTHYDPELLYRGSHVVRGSIEHGRSLNYVLNKLPGTKGPMLIIDPDFYLIDGTMVHRFATDILNGEFAMLASTWHKRWTTKSQNWVAPHFVLFDSARIEPAALDFSPGFVISDDSHSSPVRHRIRDSVGDYVYSKTLSRFRSGTSLDTGHKIAQQMREWQLDLRLLAPRSSRRMPKHVVSSLTSACTTTKDLQQLSKLIQRSEMFEDPNGVWAFHLRKQTRNLDTPSPLLVRTAAECLLGSQLPD